MNPTLVLRMKNVIHDFDVTVFFQLVCSPISAKTNSVTNVSLQSTNKLVKAITYFGTPRFTPHKHVKSRHTLTRTVPTAHVFRVFTKLK